MSLASEIEEVKAVLQPLFAKPALKDNLLEKPPFRFVHDVVTAVTKATGFGDTLFADREDLLDAKAIKEKQDKLDFLDRVILFVGHIHGRPCDVKSGKIVAGLEPERTARLFVDLGKAATSSTPEARQEAQELAIAKEDPKRPAGGGAGAKDDGGTKEVAPPSGDAKEETEAPGPGSSAAQAKPPPSRGGGQRNSAAKEEVAPRSGGMEVMGPDSAASYEAFMEQCTGDIAVTIQLMGELIPKPKMTEKLLSKPPFRFLHDVFTAVVDTTGFGSGLLDDDEKDGKELSKASKEAKIAFLEKVKAVVGFSLNTMVEARPAKVVAGLEPENTNRLLQLLAVAAKHCPDSAKAVAMARDGAPSQAPARAPAAEEKGGDPAPAQRSGPADAEQGSSEPAKAAAKEPSLSAAAKDEGPSAAAPGPRADQDMGAPSSSAMAKSGGDEKGADDGAEGDLSGMEAEPKRSMRPTTARRRPPKVKDNVQTIDQPTPAAAAAGPKAAAHIIVDGADAGDSDDDEDAKADGGGFGVVADEAEGASKLVRDIEAEARGEAKGGSEEKEAANDPSKGIRLGKIKKGGPDGKGGSSKKGMASWSEQDMEALRGSVQKLCQSTNPLGKCMDFVHEDLAAMAKEHERWTKE
jgi:TRAF3-interacting protein 1